MIAEQLMATSRLLGNRLLDAHLMAACAESCTGGLLAATITDIAGSSQWFDRGFITYSNAAKVDHLGVSTDTLERFGAVSEETAMEMASGALNAAPLADIAISTTGIAGPDGATAGKPVGMVCFGFARRTPDGLTMRAITHTFTGNRQQIRQAAVEFAMRTVLEITELH